jgi:hypothetical protein
LLPKAHGDAATWNSLFRRILHAINSHLEDAFVGMEDGQFMRCESGIKFFVTDAAFSLNPYSFHRCIGKECSECIDAKGPRTNLALRWHGKPDN